MDLSNQSVAPFSNSTKSTSSVGNMRRPSLSTETSLTALPAPSNVANDHRIQDKYVLPQNESGHKSSPSPKPPYLSTTPSAVDSPNSRSTTPTLRQKSSLGSIRSPPHSPAIRRTFSTTISPSSNVYIMRNTPPAEQLSPPMTAAHVARTFFQEDLKAHGTGTGSQDTELAVILHDACYGHRYARPRTSKANLSTIVERPERIKAITLGLAAAYVRLGGRHAEGQYPPQGQRAPHVPIPFSISKSTRQVSLTALAVTNVHGLKWMQELSSMCHNAEARLTSNGRELVRANSEANSEPSLEKPRLHEGDLYLCSESLDALEGSLGAVCEAVDQVFSDSITKRAFVSVRPPGHHCSADYPSGFCWINNVHVGISHAAQAHGLTHAAIIDFDLHHGDGSQAITWAHNAAALRLPKNASVAKKASIGYFSLHDINSYPCEYGDEEKVQNASLCIENAHGQTIWNTHLQTWKKESEFWHLYETRYSVLIEKARAFLLHHSMRRRQPASQVPPKAAIFISAGFDASEWEGSGMQRHKVNVPTEFYARFTRDVVSLADEDGLDVAGRVISVLEGGYSDRALSSGVLSHMCGLASSRLLDAGILKSNGLSHEISGRLGKLNLGELEGYKPEMQPKTSAPLEPNWWSLKSLEELENLEKEPKGVVPAQRQTNGSAPTYTIPTQSSTAKVVSPLQPRRSMSASAVTTLQRPTSSASSRLPTPSPPEVDWATAAQELCNLLIPAHRSTSSHTHEELNAQATRARKDRQSILAPVDEAQTIDPKRMQLRDRKSKVPQSKHAEGDAKVVAQSNRRKTIADATSLIPEVPEKSDGFVPAPRAKTKVPMRRQSSVVSSTIPAVEDRRSSTPGPSESLNRRETPQIGENLTSGVMGVHLGPLTNDRNDRLVPKRTRQAPSAGPAASKFKKSGVERPPSVPRNSSSHTKQVPTQPTDSASINENDSSSRQPQPAASSDVEGLVSGLKRINLKLNPPKMPDQETLVGPKRATAKAPRKTVETKAAKAKVGRANAGDTFGPQLLATEVPLAPLQAEVSQGCSSYMDSSTALATQAASSQPEIQASLPSQAPFATSSIIPAFQAPSAMAVSAPTDGTENSHSEKENGTELITPALPSSWSPSVPLSAIVNHQSTSPKCTKGELPVFTATSPIMFAPQKEGSSSLDEMIRQGSKPDDAENSEVAILAEKAARFSILGNQERGQPLGIKDEDI